MNNNKIMVSILVNVYNHEKYLRECLTSLVNQKTNFDYEILVHDDCSSDRSKKIIEEFYNKYSEKIVPFYENENQYSKGVKINIEILMPKMRGKYFCFCEGDDFWIDDRKIQKQFDFLENNLDYKLCVNNSIKVNTVGKKIGEICPLKNGGDLSCKDFILNGGGFVSTNAIFSYSSLAKNLPVYFNIFSIDYIWQIYLSSQGKTYCFKDYMSAYRVGVNDSWTSRMKKDSNKYIQIHKKIIKVLKIFNELNDFKFDKEIKDAILNSEYEILENKKEYKILKKYPYKKIKQNKTIKRRIKYFLDEHFPKFYVIIEKLLKK